MQLPPDIGFLIQIVSFLVLWWILKAWLFEPTLRVLELRRQRTSGQLAEAERLREETAEMQAKYHAAVEAALAAAREEVAQLRAEAEREEERILEAARAEAARVVEGVRTAVAQEVEAARATMTRYAAEISVEAAEKVLGRSVQ
jgi:F-type H+-transporting ATPase subunit b